MNNTRKILAFLILVFCTTVFIWAQSSNNSLELKLINDYIKINNRESKAAALKLICDVLEEGNTDKEIYTALDYLALEGTQYVTRERGRISNDYPDIRREAVRCLGVLGTAQAKNTLVKVCQVEKELLILYEAVKSLGVIGNNDNNTAVNAIIMIDNKYQQRPDNRLASVSIDALGKIAEKNNGIEDPGAIRLLLRIVEGPYNKDIKERARQTSTDIRKYSLKD